MAMVIARYEIDRALAQILQCAWAPAPNDYHIRADGP
jgi:hypothetical protein